jgi:hypothetical protein
MCCIPTSVKERDFLKKNGNTLPPRNNTNAVKFVLYFFLLSSSCSYSCWIIPLKNILLVVYYVVYVFLFLFIFLFMVFVVYVFFVTYNCVLCCFSVTQGLCSIHVLHYHKT